MWVVEMIFHYYLIQCIDLLYSILCYLKRFLIQYWLFGIINHFPLNILGKWVIRFSLGQNIHFLCYTLNIAYKLKWNHEHEHKVCHNDMYSNAKLDKELTIWPFGILRLLVHSSFVCWISSNVWIIDFEVIVVFWFDFIVMFFMECC